MILYLWKNGILPPDLGQKALRHPLRQGALFKNAFFHIPYLWGTHPEGEFAGPRGEIRMLTPQSCG